MAQEYIRRFTGREGQVVELIVQPPEPNADDWQCVYRVIGLGTLEPTKVMGADAIQAFTLALTFASTALYFSEEYEKGELAWEGGISIADLGLPVAEIVRDEVEAKKLRVAPLLQDKISMTRKTLENYSS